MLTFFYLYLKNMSCHRSLFLHLKLNSLNYYSRKVFCMIRSYQTTLTLARRTGPTRLPLSQMLSAPDHVLFQRKLTNFQKLLFIYTKSIKNGYYRSKKSKMFYLSQYIKKTDLINQKPGFLKKIEMFCKVADFILTFCLVARIHN